MSGESVLRVEGVHTYIGESHILQGVSFAVAPGRVSSSRTGCDSSAADADTVATRASIVRREKTEERREFMIDS